MKGLQCLDIRAAAPLHNWQRIQTTLPREDTETDYQRVGQPPCGYMLPREQKGVPIIGSTNLTCQAILVRLSGYEANLVIVPNSEEFRGGR